MIALSKEENRPSRRQSWSGAGRHGRQVVEIFLGRVLSRGGNWAKLRLVRRVRRVGFEMKWEEIKSSIALVLRAGQKSTPLSGLVIAVKME